MSANDGEGSDLSDAQCRERLLASASGLLSCTHGAMPMIVPVGIECYDGQVLLSVHDRRLCGPLPGHVVAVGVSGPGWVVAAVGCLAAGPAGALRLDISTLQGWTYPLPGRPREGSRASVGPDCEVSAGPVPVLSGSPAVRDPADRMGSGTA